ncbi:MAG: VOC family protein [Anaerolineae bacterium]|nr:VOC family protein [Anaerolineae bacterium]
MIRRINAAVLFVHNLEGCAAFYQDTLGFQETFRDAHSVAFQLKDQDFVLLAIPAAIDMISEEALSLHQAAGHRVLLCAEVEDVDAVYSALTNKGLVFIKPPKDQSWGRRTAYFADPEGNLWELYHFLASEQ